jgi:hypothetical protein
MESKADSTRGVTAWRLIREQSSVVDMKCDRDTPKAFANPSPGLERSDNPGIRKLNSRRNQQIHRYRAVRGRAFHSSIVSAHLS